MDHQRRFGGIIRLYGEDGFVQIQHSHVCVIGVGGVGSWVVESLARSGVGVLTLIDLDNVAASNINRQLVALDDTVGRVKIEVMADRVAQINPHCRVNLIEKFIHSDNLSELLSPDLDFVVDCIDGFFTKAHLIAYCRRNKIPQVTIGGAGGKIDPSKVRVSDLSRTTHDPLMSKVRYLLRTDYGFSRNAKRKFEVPCVFSEEQAIYPNSSGGVCRKKPEKGASGLNCASGFGAVTHVTATFGFYATAHVLKKLAMPRVSR